MVVVEPTYYSSSIAPGETFSNNNALFEEDHEIMNDSASDLEQNTASRHLDELLNESRSQNAGRKKITEDDILSEATSLLNELLMDSPPVQTTTKTTIKSVEKTHHVTSKLPKMRIKVNSKATYRQQEDLLPKQTNVMKELLDDGDHEDINDLPAHTKENTETVLSESTSETSLASSGTLNETGYNSLSQSETEEDTEDEDDASSVGSVDLDTLLNDITSPATIQEEDEDELEDLEGEQKEDLNSADAEVTLRSDSPQLAPSPCPTEDRVMVREHAHAQNYVFKRFDTSVPSTL